jgi:uncharacterized membrane protein
MTHTPPHNARFAFFLVLSIIGLVTAWVFNAIGVAQGESYLEAWFKTPLDWVLSLDILIVAVAGSAFMIFEAKKLGMKRVWLYIVLSGVTAFAFTFPLFLAMRERTLARLESATA